MRPFPAILVLLLSVTLAASASAQMQQTLPAGFISGTGGSGSSYPFSTTADHTWQWHYDSAQFAFAGPIIITEVYIRGLSAAPSAFDFPSVELTMASSPTDYTVAGNGMQPGHDPIFANNLNSDATIVRPAAPWVDPAPPFAWMPMGMTTPFVYDPSLGNDFVLQILKCGTNASWGQSIFGASGTAGLNGGNRYGDTSSCSSTTQTFSNNEFVPIILIDYNPAAGTYPSFTASPNSGQAPLTVNFTDTTFTSDPVGITSWAWDFDNDMVIDSTSQNPTFTYLSPGSQTVTLTVTDATFGTTTASFPNAVQVDQYTFSAVTTGGGVGDLTITPIPLLGAPTSSRGYTLVSFLATGTLGGGPVFGIYPDGFTWPIFSIPPSVGNPLHYLVAPGAYPDVPLVVPAGALTAFGGLTLDFVQIAVDPGFNLVLVSNVDRAAF